MLSQLGHGKDEVGETMGVTRFTQRTETDKGQHPSKEPRVERQAESLPDRKRFGP